MQNPWSYLPKSDPYVLAEDHQIIQDFNKQAKDKLQIHLELLPQPYLGDPQAKVILLNLNPGYSKDDILLYRNNADFLEDTRANLTHDNPEYPFYLLNPKYASTPGFHWWQTKLRQLIDRYGLTKVAHALCVIEYFPYPSQGFGIQKTVPSQAYGFYLVEEAMKRNALIIQMRSRATWQNAIQSLKSYRNYYILKNPQNPAISEGNCPNGYPEILRILG